MAALSIGHSFHSRNCSIQQFKTKNNCPTTLNTTIYCQSRLPVDPETEKGKEKEKQKEKKKLLPEQVLVSVGNFGKRLKDNLSPKQKGDWKDLMLMSLSFAVYVYISQRIVCAYCAWMSMTKQPW